MPNGNGYSPSYTPTPVNWFGDFMGNLGQSWQGGSDQAMYADPNTSVPYATYQGVVTSPPGQAGIAVGQAAANAVTGVEGFFMGLARGGGMLLGAAIIAIALANEGRQRR